MPPSGPPWPPIAGAAGGYHAPMTEHPRPSLTLVLPAYNEAERLPGALDELFGYCLLYTSDAADE